MQQRVVEEAWNQWNKNNMIEAQDGMIGQF